MLWHHNRVFELTLTQNKLRMPAVLPEVPRDMFKEFVEWVNSQSSEDLPAHRRIDSDKAVVRCSIRKGTVSLVVSVMDGDYDYAVRKLIALVHETYLVFIHDGRYFDWMIETFKLDPDNPLV
jgi:hypothetical protein